MSGALAALLGPALNLFVADWRRLERFAYGFIEALLVHNRQIPHHGSMDDPYEMYAGMLPYEEREAWHYIRDNLSDLHWFAGQIHSASRLLDHCQELISKAATPRDAVPLEMWSYIPVRDAAINIYNFAQTKDAIHKLAGRSPTIRAHIDEKKKAEAGRLLEEAAPRFGLIRQSVGHAGELLSTPKRRMENRFGTDRSSTFIKGVVSGRRYTGTVSGKVVSYELNEELAFGLSCCATAMVDSFLPLAALTRKENLRKRK